MKKTDKITLGKNYKIFKRSVPHHNLLQNSIAREVSRVQHHTVIDLGVGLGYTTEAVLKVINPKHLYLVDLDQRMIEIAMQNKKIIRDTRLHVTFSNEDILFFLLNIKSETIDCIYSCWVIHNLPKKLRAKIVKEIFRVLKKGGTFVNGDKYTEMNKINHQASFDWQENEYKKAIKLYPKDKAVYKAWISHYREDDRNRFYESEQIDLCKKLKFKKFLFKNRYQLEAVFVAQK